eukprot:3139771-Alexandrium_andersonii.AAC.1
MAPRWSWESRPTGYVIGADGRACSQGVTNRRSTLWEVRCEEVSALHPSADEMGQRSIADA